MRTHRPAGRSFGKGSRAHRADIGGMRTATPPRSYSKMPSRAHPKRFSPNCLSCIGGFSYFSHYVVKTLAIIVVSRFSFAMRTHRPARCPSGEGSRAHPQQLPFHNIIPFRAGSAYARAVIGSKLRNSAVGYGWDSKHISERRLVFRFRGGGPVSLSACKSGGAGGVEPAQDELSQWLKACVCHG